MEALAEARGVSRRFGTFTAVSQAGLRVGRGEVVGLLGANGAGKTTLIRMLLGLLLPSEGLIRLFGSPPSIAARRRTGYVPQTLGLYAGLSIAENWAFTTAAFRSSGARLPGDLSAWRDTPAGKAPLGVQRRAAFALALSHEPELLVLDEPTSGVGPLGSARLWERIRESAGRGTGVIVTTHNMEEAGQCDHLVVMADGRVVARGSTTEIIAGRTVAEVRCGDYNRAFALLDAAGIPVQLHGRVLRVGGVASAAAALLRAAGIDAAIETVPANLEEAFVAIVANPAAGLATGPPGEPAGGPTRGPAGG
jgi:ABC-2 type transport system ATP-binding protein/ribosome-dependent ATPase